MRESSHHYCGFRSPEVPKYNISTYVSEEPKCHQYVITRRVHFITIVMWCSILLRNSRWLLFNIIVILNGIIDTLHCSCRTIRPHIPRGLLQLLLACSCRFISTSSLTRRRGVLIFCTPPFVVFSHYI